MLQYNSFIIYIQQSLVLSELYQRSTKKHKCVHGRYYAHTIMLTQKGEHIVTEEIIARQRFGKHLLEVTQLTV
jgi:hypothetical protein